ncbi:MAG: NADH:flavin oxidoreductase/NADH oxidase [Burkholderiales bacterium]|nr:NADH:flavin oxidoreductase/NADH oxidase [Burkholderiales bacterium]
MTSALFKPLTLRKLVVPNRIMVSPMCQYSAIDGNASDWHMIHLGQLALGGAGLLCIEATAVEAPGRITPNCLGLYSDENESALRRVLEALRHYADTPLALQLAHAGRKASSFSPWEGGKLIVAESGGWVPIAPSALSFSPSEPPPREMSVADLKRVREAFVLSAKRCVRLGIDALELHAAHGYLLHEFLSPLSNRRNDDYGGSLENRMRYPLEVFSAVRKAWPDSKPLGVRISASDWIEGGWDLEQSIEFARQLKALGCDWIDASSGGLAPEQKITLGPGYQVQFAEAIRREVDMPTIAVGLITEPRQAEDIVAAGRADMVALARGMLYEPHWAWRAAAELGGEVRAPKQYWRSAPRGAEAIFGDAKVGQR